MAKRGRKSAAELETMTVFPAGKTGKVETPDAPYELTDTQAAIWRGIVNRLPADFIAPEQFELLASYCRHVTSARLLALEIDRYEQDWLTDDEGLVRYGRLLAAREREVRSMNALARALRLTNQARYRPESAAGKAKAGANAALWTRPWE